MEGDFDDQSNVLDSNFKSIVASSPPIESIIESASPTITDSQQQRDAEDRSTTEGEEGEVRRG